MQSKIKLTIQHSANLFKIATGLIFGQRPFGKKSKKSQRKNWYGHEPSSRRSLKHTANLFLEWLPIRLVEIAAKKEEIVSCTQSMNQLSKALLLNRSWTSFHVRLSYNSQFRTAAFKELHLPITKTLSNIYFIYNSSSILLNNNCLFKIVFC